MGAPPSLTPSSHLKLMEFEVLLVISISEHMSGALGMIAPLSTSEAIDMPRVLAQIILA
jgi:hypothetical protein